MDDERSIREVLAAFLQDEGYTVRTARDGQRALETMQREPPDLLVMDCMMPEMDGREVVRELRSRPGLVSTPVILMSSAAWPNLDGLGGVTFLSKPFDLDHLLSTIRRLLPTHV